MLLEYLAVQEVIEKVETHFSEETDKINISIGNLSDTTGNIEYHIISFFLKSNDEKSAKTLSDVNDWMMTNTEAVVLTNESSSYYNKRLYPEVNAFERNLRKLLYISVYNSTNSKAKDIVKDLETKDLGEIYKILFTDDNFVSETRKLLGNSKSSAFSKQEIIDSILKIQENSLWQEILKDKAPTLVSKFLELKSYRNDVMHAHNVSYNQFNEARTLFEKANNEMIEAIKEAVDCKEYISSDYIDILGEALKAFDSKAIIEKIASDEKIKNIIRFLDEYNNRQ